MLVSFGCEIALYYSCRDSTCGVELKTLEKDLGGVLLLLVYRTAAC